MVRYDAKAGERSLDVMRWGLVPFWATDIKVGFSNINAKAEGIAWRRREVCLIPDTATVPVVWTASGENKLRLVAG